MKNMKKRFCLLALCIFSNALARVSCQKWTDDFSSDGNGAHEQLVPSTLDDNNRAKEKLPAKKQISLASILAHQVERSDEVTSNIIEICRYIQRLWGNEKPMSDPLFRQLCASYYEEYLNHQVNPGGNPWTQKQRDFANPRIAQRSHKLGSASYDPFIGRRVEHNDKRSHVQNEHMRDYDHIDYTTRYLSNNLTEKATPIIHTKSIPN